MLKSSIFYIVSALEKPYSSYVTLAKYALYVENKLRPAL